MKDQQYIKIVERQERLESQYFQYRNERIREEKVLRKEQRRMKKIFMVQAVLSVFLICQLVIIILLTNLWRMRYA